MTLKANEFTLDGNMLEWSGISFLSDSIELAIHFVELHTNYRFERRTGAFAVMSDGQKRMVIGQ